MKRSRDLDPVETQEWLESLDGVLEVEGAERAHFLLEQVIDGARKRAHRCRSRRTQPISTRSRREAGAASRRPCAGAAHTLGSSAGMPSRSWCAPTRIDRARRPHRQLPVRGHAVRRRLHAFLARGERDPRRRPHLLPGPLLARHLCPRLPRRAAHRGAAAQLPSGGGRQGLSSYPHPWLMPDFWQFPTVSMGLGPLMAIYQARFLQAICTIAASPIPRPQGLGLHGRRRDG